ncbi:sulfotransferase family protein [Amycolatopsis eburnea]|nr:sulfotransferase [Amycolatopsis eburnea]
MIGTQRSGSNLLRLMLAQGPVFAPPSAHLLRDLQFFADSEAPLLAAAMCELLDRNVLAWPEGSYCAARLLAQGGHAGLADMVVTLYDSAATRLGHPAWVCKCLENVHHLGQIRGAAPELSVLHLVRDPRDVALSFSRAPIGPKEPHMIAFAWRADQRAALAAERTGDWRRWVRVRYEDLVRNCDSVLQHLCRALEISFTPKMANFNASEEAVRTASLSPLWTGLSSPVTTSRIGQFRQPRHRRFVIAVEDVLADDMEEFGYRPLYRTRSRNHSAAELSQFVARDEALRRQAAGARDPRREAVFNRREHLLSQLRLGNLNPIITRSIAACHAEDGRRALSAGPITDDGRHQL